jgi:NADH:ubiquinone oxidoreductase subunit 2 (subunit N)
MVKFLIFLLFCFISYHFNNNLVLDFIALSSLLIGTILTLRQLEIKRFLAYSSITHVGFLLISDLSASFIYILTYVISSLLFFSVLLSIKIHEHEMIYLNDLRYLKKNGH